MSAASATYQTSRSCWPEQPQRQGGVVALEHVVVAERPRRGHQPQCVAVHQDRRRRPTRSTRRGVEPAPAIASVRRARGPAPCRSRQAGDRSGDGLRIDRRTGCRAPRSPRRRSGRPQSSAWSRSLVEGALAELARGWSPRRRSRRRPAPRGGRPGRGRSRTSTPCRSSTRATAWAPSASGLRGSSGSEKARVVTGEDREHDQGQEHPERHEESGTPRGPAGVAARGGHSGIGASSGHHVRGGARAGVPGAARSELLLERRPRPAREPRRPGGRRSGSRRRRWTSSRGAACGPGTARPRASRSRGRSHPTAPASGHVRRARPPVRGPTRSPPHPTARLPAQRARDAGVPRRSAAPRRTPRRPCVAGVGLARSRESTKAIPATSTASRTRATTGFRPPPGPGRLPDGVDQLVEPAGEALQQGLLVLRTGELLAQPVPRGLGVGEQHARCQRSRAWVTGAPGCGATG